MEHVYFTCINLQKYCNPPINKNTRLWFSLVQYMYMYMLLLQASREHNMRYMKRHITDSCGSLDVSQSCNSIPIQNCLMAPYGVQ